MYRKNRRTYDEIKAEIKQKAEEQNSNATKETLNSVSDFNLIGNSSMTNIPSTSIKKVELEVKEGELPEDILADCLSIFTDVALTAEELDLIKKAARELVSACDETQKDIIEAASNEQVETSCNKELSSKMYDNIKVSHELYTLKMIGLRVCTLILTSGLGFFISYRAGIFSIIASFFKPNNLITSTTQLIGGSMNEIVPVTTSSIQVIGETVDKLARVYTTYEIIKVGTVTLITGVASSSFSNYLFYTFNLF